MALWRQKVEDHSTHGQLQKHGRRLSYVSSMAPQDSVCDADQSCLCWSLSATQCKSCDKLPGQCYSNNGRWGQPSTPQQINFHFNTQSAASIYFIQWNFTSVIWAHSLMKSALYRTAQHYRSTHSKRYFATFCQIPTENGICYHEKLSTLCYETIHWHNYCRVMWKRCKSITIPGIWTHQWYPTATD